MTRLIIPGHICPTFVREIKAAASLGTYGGIIENPQDRLYLNLCTHLCHNTLTKLIFTRDTGMHSGGWWKNPDFERCYHASFSFAVSEGGEFHDAPQDKHLAARWCEALFGDDRRLLWIKPPFSAHGRTVDVWHYRLFCDEAWQAIKPEGEVYDTKDTPAYWQSWSELHGADVGDGEFGSEVVKREDSA